MAQIEAALVALGVPVAPLPSTSTPLPADAACYKAEHDLKWEIWGLVGGNVPGPEQRRAWTFTGSHLGRGIPCETAADEVVVRQACRAALWHARNPAEWTVADDAHVGPDAFEAWAASLGEGRALLNHLAAVSVKYPVPREGW